jgi:hypothetical protein
MLMELILSKKPVDERFGALAAKALCLLTRIVSGEIKKALDMQVFTCI